MMRKELNFNVEKDKVAEVTDFLPKIMYTAVENISYLYKILTVCICIAKKEIFLLLEINDFFKSLPFLNASLQ